MKIKIIKIDFYFDWHCPYWINFSSLEFKMNFSRELFDLTIFALDLDILWINYLLLSN